MTDLRVAFEVNRAPVMAVKGLDFRVCAGAVTAIVGESGSGKSVTAQAIMNILPRNGTIESGTIEFRPDRDGPVIDLATLERSSPEMRSLRGSSVAMIFQEPMSSLSPVHSVGDQVEESLRIHALGEVLSRKELRARTEETLELVGFPDPHRAYDMYPFEMSGGLRQRAMIAMALICRPALLIADEPTTALDVTVQAQILKLLKDLQQQLGMAVLLITHDLGVVANMADEVVVVYDGKVVEAGPVEEIFRAPQHIYLKALLEAAPHFEMNPGHRLVALRGGDRPTEPSGGVVKRSQPDHRPLLTVSNLSKTYTLRRASIFLGEERVIRAVDDVNFTIRRGECLGLVGESGSGKTTVSKILTRAITPDTGSVVFDDGTLQTDILALDSRALKRFRPRVQMVFQDPVSSLSPRMTVADILMEPMRIHGQGGRKEQLARARTLLRSVELPETALNRYPHSFSGGQRQRVGIARALAMQPDLLILDEPVSALDVSVQAQVLNLLKDLQSELGLTYLFIAHNLAVVKYMADRVAVMAAGRIVEIGPCEALFAAPAHPYTRALLKAVPFADLDRPLVLDELVLRGSSDPRNWPEAFRGDDASPLDLGGGHQVLVRPNVDFKELRA